MTNAFNDQSKFMRACDQVVDRYDEAQYNMYKSLIKKNYEHVVSIQFN